MAGLPQRSTLVEIVGSAQDIRRSGRAGAVPTIYAQRPWRADSPAVVLSEEARGGVAPSMPGYSYMLELHLAVEALEAWSRSHAGSATTPEQAAEALIHYAAHDAHQPLTCQRHGCGRPGVRRCAGCDGLLCGRHADASSAEVLCATCLSRRPATTAVDVKAVVRALWGTPLSRALQFVGLLSTGIGALAGSVPAMAGGTCILVLGMCVWIGALVMGRTT